MARYRKSQSKIKPIKPRRRVPPKARYENGTGCACSSHIRIMSSEESKKHNETFLKFYKRRTSTPKRQAKNKRICGVRSKVSAKNSAKGTVSKNMLSYKKNNERRKKQTKTCRKIVKHTRRKPKPKGTAKKTAGASSNASLLRSSYEERRRKLMKTFMKYMKKAKRAPRGLRRVLTEEEVMQIRRTCSLNDFNAHFTSEETKESKIEGLCEQFFLEGIKQENVVESAQERNARIQEWLQPIEIITDDSLLVPKIERDYWSDSEC